MKEMDEEIKKEQLKLVKEASNKASREG